MRIFQKNTRVRLSPHYFEVYGGDRQQRGVVVSWSYANFITVLFDGAPVAVRYHRSFLELDDAADPDVCEIDLTNTPILRELLEVR